MAQVPHRWDKHDVCVWCRLSRAHHERTPATPMCSAAPPEERAKAAKREEMDGHVWRAIGRAVIVLALLLPAVARAAEPRHPTEYRLPAQLVEQIGQYLGQRPLAEVIGIYTQLASCIANQTGNPSATCPGLSPAPTPPPK